MPRHLPFTIKIELVRGCTMRCPFCPLPEMAWVDDAWEFMSMSTFENIVYDLKDWRPKVRVEFAERGEQSFHKQFFNYVRFMRNELPLVQMTITSNGDLVTTKYKHNEQDFVSWVHAALNNGINIVMLDCYTDERYARFKELFADEAVLFYEDDYHPYRYIGPKEKTILLVDGTHGANHKIRRWHNAGGSVNIELARSYGYEVASIVEPMEAMCVKPFREMEIHVDGTMPLCCNDWKHETVIGNINDVHLWSLWDALDEYREPLLRKARSEIIPCNVCSDRAGFRVGLEMDWFAES